MEIGKKLKEARIRAGMTQEHAAEEAQVSRQTISNWENERSYPDIVSVIKLGELYSISLDELLKGDRDMMNHLEESTNIVKSNKKLIAAIIANMAVLAAIIILANVQEGLENNILFLSAVFSLAVISASALLYQIIKRI